MSVNLFDVNFYRAANTDLAGLNDAQLQSHFQQFGLNEGRRFSAFADLNFYRASNSDLAGFNNSQAYEHLSNNGVREGRKFTPFADLGFYRSHNSDLTSFNNEQLFEHLRSSGVGQGRQFSLFVDLKFYRSANGDLAGFNNNQALQHLEIYGVGEGRSFSPVVDLDFYLAANSDLTRAFGANRQQALQDLELNGLNEGRRFSVAYDTNYYRSNNTDLIAAKLNNSQLLEHFEFNGLNEGRASSDRFNVSYYLANNADLKAANFTNQQALQHFDLYGFQEGRRGNSNVSATSKPVLTRIRQIGTSGDDSGRVNIDSAGNVYILGSTSGSLGGVNAGNYDAFVTKYDSRGNQLWTRQVGTSGYDSFIGNLGVDSAGNVYISGLIDGSVVTPRSITGATAVTFVSDTDTLLTKFDRDGNLLFSKTVITSFSTNFSNDLALDTAGNVYLSGFIDNDGFVGKYDSSGNQLWRQDLSTSSEDNSFGITVDKTGNVYVTGYTDGTLGASSAGGRDAYVAKYNTNGTPQWVQQLGTSSEDLSYKVATDSTGNIYITGNTTGSLGGTNAGGSDAFVAKYNTNGTRLWTKQLGTSSNDYSGSIAIDAAGNVYIAGSTQGSLGGTNAGDFDGWFAKYDTNGNLLWTQQLGTSGFDRGFSVAVNSAGNIYIGGETTGSLGGANAGSYDVWVARYI